MNSIRVSVALCCLGAGGVAVAGERLDYSVRIDPVFRYAYASMAGARSSPDSTQRAKCSVIATQVNLLGVCDFVDAEGVSAKCTTTHQFLLEAIKTVNGDSYVYFAWNPEGLCTRIDVENGSPFGPKI
ncbi:hypothetical protein MYSTI_05306 [Myxococcus stipitatus DSM 14675]|uniref:Lipoprotein n=1 Tax=Myxococcus stipitatus (strain DSM 14675 / JCM 12634 / Mx s8) TaxID=1278073 RepID=L7UCG2_MYXSD|nr:hypothetical protein [Myxococcus stipitatus]AGC46586.1 hypothetical protein MYSTI_05306 [Myxococcus stipitatus DSM 14675]